MFSAIVRVALSLFGTQQTKPTNADNRGCCIMNDIKFNFVGEKNMSGMGKFSKVLLVAALTTSAVSANARSLFYGMERQVYAHATAHQIETDFFDEGISNQRFYGAKLGFRAMPKTSGAIVGVSYTMMGEKNFAQGEKRIKPNLHNFFTSVGLKSTTRSRLTNVYADLGMGSVLAKGTGHKDAAAAAIRGGVGLEKRFSRFSPWSVQMEAEAIYLLNDISNSEDAQLVAKDLYSASLGVAYRF